MNSPTLKTELLKLTSKVRYRAVGEDGVLVHLDNGQVIVVNEVGLHIVHALQKGSTRRQMAASIVQTFDITLDQADRDLELYLAELDREQVLERGN